MWTHFEIQIQIALCFSQDRRFGHGKVKHRTTYRVLEQRNLGCHVQLHIRDHSGNRGHIRIGQYREGARTIQRVIKRHVRKRRSEPLPREEMRNADVYVPAVKHLCVDLRVERDLRRASCALRLGDYPSGYIGDEVNRRRGQMARNEGRGQMGCQRSCEAGQELGVEM